MKLTELEAAARAATPGPWILATSNSWRRYLSQTGHSVCEPTKQADGHADLWFRNGGVDGPDALYIAAMSPDVALKLIAVAQAAPAVVEAMAECLEIARQWEPDGSTGIERRWLVLGRDARNALRNAIAALERTE